MKQLMALVQWAEETMEESSNLEGGKNDIWLFNFTTMKVQSLSNNGKWMKHKEPHVWSSPRDIQECFKTSTLLEAWAEEV